MRFVHVSDLHIGKQLYGYSLVEDQRHVLRQILDIVRDRKADALLVAGDFYDRSIPSEEPVKAASDFLIEACSEVPVYMVAGNHDSGERLGFADGLLEKQGLTIAGRFEGKAQRTVLTDADGPLNLYLLPYIKTSTVRAWCRNNGMDQDAVGSPDAAFQLALSNSGVDPDARNVLVAHQYIAGSGVYLERSDSEDPTPDSVGGADCMSASLLTPFDYVALGHIHKPQKVLRDGIRYCGSPLMYSDSEVRDTKAALVVDVGKKGDLSVSSVPLTPLHRLIKIEGTMDEVLALAADHRNDYVVADISGPTDRAMERLRAVCPYALHINYVSCGRMSGGDGGPSAAEVASMSPKDLFAAFFERVTGERLTSEQERMVEDAIREVLQ